eukprot:GHVU01109822.1.p3 GENE.GHVU01109822.1~~GHVU01109822.1.p3  ORF type:complete len:144 (+),score=9.90 GHVU01109822.1:324-755(+)
MTPTTCHTQIPHRIRCEPIVLYQLTNATDMGRRACQRRLLHLPSVSTRKRTVNAARTVETLDIRNITPVTLSAHVAVPLQDVKGILGELWGGKSIVEVGDAAPIDADEAAFICAEARYRHSTCLRGRLLPRAPGLGPRDDHAS